MESNRSLKGNELGPMAVLSVLFHLAVMVLILFVPDSLPGGKIDGVVYEVSLVDMPSSDNRSLGKGAAVAATNETKVKTVVQESEQTKRIAVEKEEKKPLTIAKRTIERKDLLVKKSDLSPNKLIDKAISKIEEKVQSDDSSHLDNALSKIEKETGNLRQTRPTFGGNLMATIRTPVSRPQMATVRPGIFKANKELHKKVKITTIEKKLEEKDSVTKLLKIIKKQKAQINLEDADIIVSGGRGVGSKEGFKLIKELAEVLGAEIGGSRVTVELNWIDADRQVGQTGKTISPKLYIACGISGAIQHLVGMQNSEIIVAINRDPNAPIFSVAHYCIVGDLHKVLPILIEEVKKIKAEE